jgi:hypothetical protein
VRKEVRIAFDRSAGQIGTDVGDSFHDLVCVLAIQIPQSRSFLFGAISRIFLREQSITQQTHPVKNKINQRMKE